MYRSTMLTLSSSVEKKISCQHCLQTTVGGWGNFEMTTCCRFTQLSCIFLHGAFSDNYAELI